MQMVFPQVVEVLEAQVTDKIAEMLIRSMLLNTDKEKNKKNTHAPCCIWEDTVDLDIDFAPNRTDKTTGDDCRRGTV